MIEEAAAWEIHVNGIRVQWDGGPGWRDPAFLTVSVGACFQRGENEIILTQAYVEPRIFSPAHQPREVGVEINPVMVMGNFTLTSEAVITAIPHRDWDLTGLPLPDMIDASVPRVLLPPQPLDLGDITRSGAPHYAGELRCTRDLEWAGGPARFVCDAVRGGVARLLVDGVDHGLLPWGPWSWDLGELPPGTHQVTLVLANTLRNALNFMYREQGDEHFVHLATYEYAQRLMTLGRPPDLPQLPADRVRLNPFGVTGPRFICTPTSAVASTVTDGASAR